MERRTGRGDRKYWIYATPTHNTACTIFVRFPFHAVASYASIAPTNDRLTGECNLSNASANEITQKLICERNKTEHFAKKGEIFKKKEF